MIVQPEQLATYSLRNSPHGFDICKVLAAAINAADAGIAVKNNISCDDEHLITDKGIFTLRKYNRILVIGAGKAVFPMTGAINEILGDRITAGLVIASDGYQFPKNIFISSKVKLFQASHPVPNQQNIDAGVELSSLIHGLKDDDLVIFLLSGGGSSLLMNPSPGISLQDVQKTTALLLKSGAPIAEFNIIRKHLDRFKGGGLAKMLYPATVITLILSDVVGDSLDVIASGPTVADPTTFRDARNVLSKYQILDQVPAPVTTLISAGIQGEIPDTVKPGDPILQKVSNIVIGSNLNSAISASDEAKRMGYYSSIMTTTLQGEASRVGNDIVEEVKMRLQNTSGLSRPVCLIAGGETTVTIKGSGIGGRNQEVALGAVNNLSGSDQFLLISLATDGVDGPTDAAGAIATNDTYNRGLEIGLYPQDYLNRNDSYNYFNPLGDLIKTGPTLTNVNDLVLLFVL